MLDFHSAIIQLSVVCQQFSVFESIFGDDILSLMVTESRKYALFLNCPNPKITLEEMKVFIGILIVSGYNMVPGKASVLGKQHVM